MRTLALTDTEIFPPRNGETIPVAAHLSALAALGPVDVACLGFRPSSPATVPGGITEFAVTAERTRSVWIKACRNLRGDVPGRLPAKLASPGTQLPSRQYDLIYASQMRLIDWARTAKACQPDAAMMLNLSDSPRETRRRLRRLAGDAGFRPDFRLISLARGMQAGVAARWEAELAATFDAVLVQSANDRRTVAGSADPRHAERIVVAPNGVRDEAFGWSYRGHHHRRLLHLGGLAGERFHLVLWFIRQVFGPLLRSHPTATLHLVGSVSPGKRAALERCPNVVCHGFTEDLQPLMEEATASVAPMMMQFGVINKVAESMAAGLPATGLGAFSGFPGLVPGRHAVEAHSAAEWVRQLRQLLDSPRQLSDLSQHGRDYARQQLNWERTARTIQQTAASIVGAAGTRRTAGQAA